MTGRGREGSYLRGEDDMAFLVPIFTKLAWWLVPQILDRLINYLEAVLRAVEAAEVIEDYNERRLTVLTQVGGWLPETATRLMIEACVILFRLGVTGDRLDACQALVTGSGIGGLTSAEKRAAVLHDLCQMFPDMPERAGRLIVEFCVAKVRSGAGVAPVSDGQDVRPTGA